MSHYQKPQGWGSWGWKFLGSVPASALPSQSHVMASLGSSCGPRMAAAAHRGQSGVENVSVLHKYTKYCSVKLLFQSHLSINMHMSVCDPGW